MHVFFPWTVSVQRCSPAACFEKNKPASSRTQSYNLESGTWAEESNGFGFVSNFIEKRQTQKRYPCSNHNSENASGSKEFSMRKRSFALFRFPFSFLLGGRFFCIRAVSSRALARSRLGLGSGDLRHHLPAKASAGFGGNEECFGFNFGMYIHQPKTLGIQTPKLPSFRLFEMQIPNWKKSCLILPSNPVLSMHLTKGSCDFFQCRCTVD